MHRVQESKQVGVPQGTAEQPSSGFDRQLFVYYVCSVRVREQERQQQTARQTY